MVYVLATTSCFAVPSLWQSHALNFYLDPFWQLFNRYAASCRLHSAPNPKVSLVLTVHLREILHVRQEHCCFDNS